MNTIEIEFEHRAIHIPDVGLVGEARQNYCDGAGAALETMMPLCAHLETRIVELEAKIRKTEHSFEHACGCVTILIDDVAELRHELEAARLWIRLEDELPPIDETGTWSQKVLIDYGGEIITAICSGSLPDLLWYHQWPKFLRAYKVTHWMPLPVLPEVQNEQI